MADRALEAHREALWRARDAVGDGQFYVAVRTTRIFCNPSCPARPKCENVQFLATREACIAAGYRACKRCHP